MTRILIHLLILLILLPGPVAAEPDFAFSVLAVQSLRVKPYDLAMEGFESAFPGKIRRIFTEKKPEDPLWDEIEKNKPDLILAIGLSALTGVLTVKDIPVLYLMVLDPPPEVQEASNITGISMSIAPDVQLDIIRKTMPGVKTIGLLYDPSKSPPFVALAREAAPGRNLILLDRPAENPKDVTAQFQILKDRMDLFWMMPDPRLLSGENMELLHLLSMESRIPMVTFSEKFLELGSLMSISLDPFDVGRQGANLARKILLKPREAMGGCVYAEKPVVTVNWKIREKLNIFMDSIEAQQIETLKK
jgi:putative ABC transport system substrate-binding protein